MFKSHNLFDKKGSTHLIAKSVKRGAWKGMRILFVAAVMLAFCAQLLGPTQTATADVAAGYSEYYVPGYSDDIAAILTDLSTYTSTTLTNVVTMPITTPDLIVYYDHWENGYLSEAAGDEVYTGYPVGTVLTFKSTAIPIPTRGTTLNACAGSTNPAGASTACYDGRDRIFVVGGAVSMSQVFWPTSTGTVYAHAWEIYPVKPWEQTYTIPVGENLYAANPTAYADYECVYVMVEAWNDTTNITFNNSRTTAPDAGVCGVNWWQDGVTTLNKGTTYIRGGVYSDSTITSDKPIEVQIIVGREDSTYDSRSHTLVPSSEWNHEYYSPVPSYGSLPTNTQTNGSNPSNYRLRKTAAETGLLLAGQVLHYTYQVYRSSSTPDRAGPVTIVDDKTTVTCPAVTTVGDFDNLLEYNENLYCTATYTVTAADIHTGSVTNISTGTIGGVNTNTSTLIVYAPALNSEVNIYMYNPTGSPLVVTIDELIGQHVCTIPGYGTMSYRDAACTGHFVPFASAVRMTAPSNFYAIGEYDSGSSARNWGFSIIPASSLRSEYFVPWAPGDYNVPPQNNGSPVFVTPTVNGQTFYVDYSPITSPPTAELTFNLDLLHIQKIRDPDNDNSGMHVWSDFPFALTWGEDEQYSGTGNPYIDAGYTINPPNADWIDVVMDVDKSANPEVILKHEDEVVEFRVDVKTYEVALDNVFIEDYLPPYFAYVTGTTNITWSGGSSTTNPIITGNAVSGYTLHWGVAPGNIGDMTTNETMTLTFDAITVLGFNANSSTNNTKGTGYIDDIALSSTASATVLAGEPGYITVIKNAIPDSAQDFAFTLINQDKPDDPTSFTLDDDGDVALSNTVTFGLRAGDYTVAEVTPLPAGWDQTSAVCVSNIVGNTPTAANIPLAEGETVTCTFTNTQQLADIMVTKSDGNVWVPRGSSFQYTITVSYPTSELTNQTATNVVMNDTLDPNVSYIEPQTPTIFDPSGLNPVCTEPATGGGGTFSCTVASMNENQSYTVLFMVQVLETAPMGGLIEFGECTTNPNQQGGQDVDICNLVSVTTTTTETNYANNNDSEPKDVGKSTSVTLIDFAATGAKKSVILTWETVSETDNAGFNLYRANSLNGKKVLVNEEGLIESLAAGNPWGAVYEYVDDGLKAKKVYFYWLEDVDVYGTATLHGPVSAKTLK